MAVDFKEIINIRDHSIQNPSLSIGYNRLPDAFASSWGYTIIFKLGENK